MFKEGFSEIPKRKSNEQIVQEKAMNEDAQNQFMFAAELYAHVHGLKGIDDPGLGNKIMEFWTEEKDGKKSYRQKYKEFIESSEFNGNSKFGGDVLKITLDDFVNRN